jgi:gamma-glutamylputrescine oxidase
MSEDEPQGYYAASAGIPPRRAALSGARQADICIIGGGYTGLSAALCAAEAGARVELLEAHTVGFGASGRNGGQIHSGLRKSQAQLEAWLGPVHARDLWTLAQDAKVLVHQHIEAHRIACELKRGLVIAAHDRAAARALDQEAEHLAGAYGYSELHMLDATETAARLGTTVYPGSQYDAGGGHLHPLLFARGLASAAESAGAVLWERSSALTIESSRSDVVVHAAAGKISAEHVILACDAYSASVAPTLGPFIAHVESFVTATAPLPPELAEHVIPSGVAVADTRHVLDYYRKSGDGRLLFAGREAYFGVPGNIAALVRPRMLHVFPRLRSVPTEYAWSGTVGITVTRMPHFGRLSERVLFAHGYSGQGVALAILGGQVLAEAALGRPERFEVFARVPPRPFPGGRFLRKPLVAAALLAFKIADAL